MKRNVMIFVITAVIGLAICLVAIAEEKSPIVAEADPNSLIDPNAIKLPEGARMPVQLKCPVHGIIGKNFIAIETETGTKVYCSQCAKNFVSKVLDLNLPKLEVVK